MPQKRPEDYLDEARRVRRIARRVPDRDTRRRLQDEAKHLERRAADTMRKRRRTGKKRATRPAEPPEIRG